jgi:hypothetical protein
LLFGRVTGGGPRIERIAELLQRWAAGDVFDATLPTATLVER